MSINKPIEVIIHWTAGTYNPSDEEKNCYHYLIDGNGDLHYGKYTIYDNFDCSSGGYAAHTGGGNTKRIGVSICGMAGYQEGKAGSEKYPIKQIQFERCCMLVGELLRIHNLKPENVKTHYEFGLENPNTTSAHKIDIMYLPHNPSLKPNEIGNHFRSKIKWYIENKLF